MVRYDTGMICGTQAGLEQESEVPHTTPLVVNQIQRWLAQESQLPPGNF